MMDLEMELLATGNSPYRAFNSAVSELNTPDLTTDLDIGKILAADNIDTQHTTAMETREDVWGHDSLTVPETNPAALEECENIDLLRWIVEDQEIDPLAACEVAQPEHPAEAKRVSVIVPMSSPSTSFYINTLEQLEQLEHQQEVKLEPLGEDEKYGKMRIQNNEASKRCRENRKRKAKEMEEELEFLEKKNQKLKETFESMEREVKAMKRRLLSNISSN